LKPRNRAVFKNLGLLSQVGLAVVAPCMLSALLGSWLDRYLGTRLMAPLSLVAGFALGLLAAYKVIDKSAKGGPSS